MSVVHGLTKDSSYRVPLLQAPSIKSLASVVNYVLSACCPQDMMLSRRGKQPLMPLYTIFYFEVNLLGYCLDEA